MVFGTSSSSHHNTNSCSVAQKNGLLAREDSGQGVKTHITKNNSPRQKVGIPRDQLTSPIINVNKSAILSSATQESNIIPKQQMIFYNRSAVSHLVMKSTKCYGDNFHQVDTVSASNDNGLISTTAKHHSASSSPPLQKQGENKNNPLATQFPTSATQSNTGTSANGTLRQALAIIK